MAPYQTLQLQKLRLLEAKDHDFHFRKDKIGAQEDDGSSLQGYCLPLMQNQCSLFVHSRYAMQDPYTSGGFSFSGPPFPQLQDGVVMGTKAKQAQFHAWHMRCTLESPSHALL